MKWIVLNIMVYCLLFLVSFLVFDSTTVILGVFFFLAALYYFTARSALRKQL